MPLKKNKKTKKIKISSLLKETYEIFKAQDFKQYSLEAELLLAQTLGCNRAFVLAHPETEVTPKKVIQFYKLVKARLAGWSSAVLLGTKDFYGLELTVNKNVLVPRPETEILVDLILAEAKLKPGALIADIGTGSGAIIISLFQNLKNSHCSFYASDKSTKALLIAKANAKKYQASVSFLTGDLLKPYLPVIKKTKPKNIIIAANLPYLKPEELKEPSIKKEPKSALLSGSDGLWHYKRLFRQLTYLKDVKIFLICEINPEQAFLIEKLARASFLKVKTYFKNDYTGRVRFFILEI